MNIRFTIEEENIIAIYAEDSRERTIDNINSAMPYMDEDMRRSRGAYGSSSCFFFFGQPPALVVSSGFFFLSFVFSHRQLLLFGLVLFFCLCNFYIKSYYYNDKKKFIFMELDIAIGHSLLAFRSISRAAFHMSSKDPN